jgi:hypothetical protein
MVLAVLVMNFEKQMELLTVLPVFWFQLLGPDPGTGCAHKQHVSFRQPEVEDHPAASWIDGVACSRLALNFSGSPT